MQKMCDSHLEANDALNDALDGNGGRDSWTRSRVPHMHGAA